MFEDLSRHTDRRIALVTGASRGIGRAIARALRDSAVIVIGVSITNRATECEKWIQCDVSDEAQVNQTIEFVLGEFGRVDILVNAAGVAHYAALTDTAVAEWNRIMAVNLTGAFMMMRGSLPSMLENNWGRIINIASTASSRGDPLMPAYVSSKHALIGLTRSAALQAGKSSVTVNAVCPGVVLTDFVDEGLDQWSRITGRSPDVGRRILQSSTPQNRFFEVEEVADLVRYLSSESARGINGQMISLCGGAAA